MTEEDKIVRIRCRAFSNEGVRLHRLRVTADGTVTVWDAVAGHYSHCHRLSPSAIRRARRAARA